ncbi:MAG: metal-dependent phosphohydrolase, partial [Pseudomonadota bacterium]
LASEFEAAFPNASAEADLLRLEASHAIAALQHASTVYHDAEHTMLATLVAQELMRGRQQVEPVSSSDWLHFLVILLLHDIGFVGGACRGDTDRGRVIDEEGALFRMPRGASDAAMIPHHVTRGMIHARERYADHPLLDADRIAAGIHGTLYPAPTGPDAIDDASEPGLARAADFVGQLADPHYLEKTVALFWELVECGIAAEAGYESPDDITARYPEFFRASVEPHLGPARGYLERTEDGRACIARLYGHLEAAR